jgi:hypothetical protein
LPRAGWATEAHGPLECYRDFRQKYARATSQPFRRAAGVFATSTRATGARLKLCQAQAVGRFPAESYSLPIPSFPLQPLRPHNARTRARARDRRWNSRHPVRRAVARGGSSPAQCARRDRDRARCRGLRTRSERRADRDGERVGGASSRSDRHDGGQAQTARGLGTDGFTTTTRVERVLLAIGSMSRIKL